MSDPCPFCGSAKIRLETPYVKSTGDLGEYEPETTYCCTAQKVNANYIKKNFHPDDAPDAESVSKL